MALQPKYTVYHSTVLDADLDEVWMKVRDMMGLLTRTPGDERTRSQLNGLVAGVPGDR